MTQNFIHLSHIDKYLYIINDWAIMSHDDVTPKSVKQNVYSSEGIRQWTDASNEENNESFFMYTIFTKGIACCEAQPLFASIIKSNPLQTG